MLVVCLATIPTLGCSGGGSDVGGACGQVQPCGGSVVGSWKLASGCFVGDPLAGTDLKSACPAASMAASDIGGTLALAFGADHTFAQTGSFTMDIVVDVPTSCSAVGFSCSDLEANYQALMLVNPEFKSVACAISGASCQCKVTYLYDANTTGTYATDRTALAFLAAGDMVPESDQYCVRGEELHDMVVDVSMPMGPMGTAKIGLDQVYMRQ